MRTSESLSFKSDKNMGNINSLVDFLPITGHRVRIDEASAANKYTYIYIYIYIHRTNAF